ncbi:MAG: rhodanese-like domain-containing protein [Bacteroidota bacterium]
MKKLTKMMLWMAILPFLLVVSCKDDDPLPEDPFTILADHLIANNLDLPDMIATGWVTARPATAGEVDGFLSTRYVIDIRSAADYAKGHIAGAVNSTLAGVLTEAENAGDKQILVVCYTGQGAGHGVVALRLSGYTDAQVLKWGMSGWSNNIDGNQDGDFEDPEDIVFDKWTGGTSSAAVGHANWTTDATATVETFEYPTITSTSSDAAAILEARVAAMLQAGFKGLPSSDIYGTPTNYHINNFWDEDAVTKYGHIDGAYRIKPLSLEGGELKYLDPDATVINYCWTGQTSSMITAYLNVIGYTAQSLKFGANGMINSELDATVHAKYIWHTPGTDYPVVQ